MSLFETLQRLLPRGRAFRLSVDKSLTKLLRGIAKAADDAKAFVDAVYLDQFAETTREIRELEREHGLPPAISVPIARLHVAAERKRVRNLSPYSLQKTLQDAGFDVYVHECWSPSGLLRNPRPHIDAPRLGRHQMRSPSSPNVVRMRGRLDSTGALFSQYSMNTEHTPQNVALNKTLQRQEIVVAPSNRDAWVGYFYIGAATFPQRAAVPESRLEELWFWVMRCRPLHLIPVLLVSPVPDSGPAPGDGVWDVTKWDQSVWN
jgi:hypothetical protein